MKHNQVPSFKNKRRIIWIQKNYSTFIWTLRPQTKPYRNSLRFSPWNITRKTLAWIQHNRKTLSTELSCFSPESKINYHSPKLHSKDILRSSKQFHRSTCIYPSIFSYVDADADKDLEILHHQIIRFDLTISPNLMMWKYHSCVSANFLAFSVRFSYIH